MKKILLITIFILAHIMVNAICDTNVPITVSQPDGTEVACFASGDEFYNWVHDANGYTIIRDPQNGFLVYATLSNDVLASSGYRVGAVNPADVGLTPWINISAEKREQIRRTFLENTPDKSQQPEYVVPTKKDNSGILNNLVIYIHFSDQPEFSKDTTTYWHMFNNLSPNYPSMRNYFRVASTNQIDIPTHFFPLTETSTIVSYQDPYPRSYYMPYNATTNPNGYDDQGEREHALLIRAVNAIKDQIPADLNLDYDGDGMVDNVCFIIKGGTTAWNTLLWPHRWSLYYGEVSINGKRVFDYNFILETHLDTNKASVLAHEMYHTFSAPDFYRYSDNNITPVGGWDLMAGNGMPPQFTASYIKYKYGRWLTEIPEITHSGTYTLYPSGGEEKYAYSIASPNSESEYFTIEFRSKKNYWETSLPNEGLIIARVNTKVGGNGNGPPDEFYIFRPDGTNTYTNGSLAAAPFSADNGRTEFSDATNPPCFLSNNQPGGIHIKNIGAVGDSMTFDVLFKEAPIVNFKALETDISIECALSFTDLSAGYLDSWSWTFEGATPETSSEQHPSNIAYNTAGTYKVSLTVTNEYGTGEKTIENYITVSEKLPVVDFSTRYHIFCSEDVVAFTDASKVCPMTWKWIFTPNTVTFVEGTTATSQNPKVIFSENGYYDVTLKVSNEVGTSELKKERMIIIGGEPFESYHEDFEGSVSFSEKGWSIEKYDANTNWTLYSLGNNKVAYMRLFKYFNIAKSEYLISPPLNLPEKNSKLSFRYAYAKTTKPYADSLIVSVSDDCGLSWQRLDSFCEDGNGCFSTTTPINTEFIPTTDSEWCGAGWGSDCITLSLSKYAGKNIKIRFETIRMQGNNIFIDDVNIEEDNSAVKENTDKNTSKIFVYPNPGTHTVFVEMNEIVANGTIYIYDMQGRLLSKKSIDEKTETVDFSDYSSGLYLIRIEGKDYSQNVKFIKL